MSLLYDGPLAFKLTQKLNFHSMFLNSSSVCSRHLTNVHVSTVAFERLPERHLRSHMHQWIVDAMSTSCAHMCSECIERQSVCICRCVESRRRVLRVRVGVQYQSRFRPFAARSATRCSTIVNFGFQVVVWSYVLQRYVHARCMGLEKWCGHTFRGQQCYARAKAETTRTPSIRLLGSSSQIIYNCGNCCVQYIGRAKRISWIAVSHSLIRSTKQI